MESPSSPNSIPQVARPLTTTIHSLPDLVLLMVFRDASLGELVYQIGLVCPRWHELAISVQMVRRRLSLSHHWPPPPVKDPTKQQHCFGHDDCDDSDRAQTHHMLPILPKEQFVRRIVHQHDRPLTDPHIDLDYVLHPNSPIKQADFGAKLYRLFGRLQHHMPHLTHLELELDLTKRFFFQGPDWLDRNHPWASTLSHVRIRFDEPARVDLFKQLNLPIKDQWKSLFQWLNSLSHLRSLHLSDLFIHSRIENQFSAVPFIQLPGALFRRLDRLAIDRFQHTFLLEGLEKLLNNNTASEHRPLRLTFPNDPFNYSPSHWEQLQRKYRNLHLESVKISAFTVHHSSDAELTPFARCFANSLRVLHLLHTLDTSNIHFTYLVWYLRDLRCLDELIIDHIKVDEQFPPDLGRHPTASLPSVRRLTLGLQGTGHEALDYLYLDQCFPSVQYVRLTHCFFNYCQSTNDQCLFVRVIQRRLNLKPVQGSDDQFRCHCNNQN